MLSCNRVIGPRVGRLPHNSKCQVITQERPVTRVPRRTVGRGLSLFAENDFVSSRLGGLCTDLSSGVDQSQHLVGPIRGTMR